MGEDMEKAIEVQITEVCPRDGFQSLPGFVATEDKVHIIHKLMDCGFKQIEITSFVHPKAIPQLKDATEVLKLVKRREGIKFRALIPNIRGLERAMDAGVDKAKLMLSASDSHSIANANCTTEEALKQFTPLIELADKKGFPLSGSISVAFGCPYEGNIPIERLYMICAQYKELGITEVSLADTTGMANPVKVKQVIRALRSYFPNFTFSLHLHNTRGMAFANACAGLEEGITAFDGSVAGIGGCPYAPGASGNIATEDMIHGFEEMGIHTGIHLDQVIQVARELSKPYSEYCNSFILKAGKCTDLKIAPRQQQKIVK